MSEIKFPIKTTEEPLSVKDQEEIINFLGNAPTQHVISLVKHRIAAGDIRALKTAAEGLSNPGYKEASTIELQETMKYRHFLEVIEELNDPEKFPRVSPSIE